MKKSPQPLRGRGALSNPDNRFNHYQSEAIDDGWGSLDEERPAPKTELIKDTAKSIISYNQSPDVPFDRSINPYRGCEHGCVYCYARPSHAYLGYSPGLDFETKLIYKANAAELLRTELAKKSYQCQPIALGINTDAYQPIEAKLGITREILSVLAQHQHPVSIVTKSAMIERDLDLLAPLAEKNLLHVAVSITSLDRELSRHLEPRAAAPQRRLKTIETLAEAGIPVSVFVAPLIPILTDNELEKILSAARQAGAQDAMYILLRLPFEISDLFEQWLQQHAPLKAERVMNRIRDSRGGKTYDANFAHRMTGTGVFAQLIKQRFKLAYAKQGFKAMPDLDRSQFVVPGTQQCLF